MNVPVYDSISKANILASEFATHFTLDNGCLPPLSSSPIPPSFSLHHFSSFKARAQNASSKLFLLLKALPFNCQSILIRSYKAYIIPRNQYRIHQEHCQIPLIPCQNLTLVFPTSR
ncbi:hypothetical protein PENTCL1PPCAC_11295, partial [Pristionchus entomophagus]